MAKIEIHGDRATIRKGGGCFLTVFGLAFAIPGLFVIGCVFIPADVRGGDELPWYVGFPFGGLFAAVGLGLAFWRGGVDIDRNRRELIRWWGIFAPWRRKVESLEALGHVAVSKEIRRSDKSTYTVYPVRLHGEGIKIHLTEPRTYPPARKWSEQVAEFLHLPIHDASTGEEVVREAGTFDESLRDRAARTGKRLEIPEAPPDLQCEVEVDGERLRIVAPKGGFNPLILVLPIGVLIFVGSLFFGFFRPAFSGEGGPPFFVVAIVTVFFVLLPVLVVVGVTVRMARGGDRELVVERDRVALGRGRKARSIPADRVEDLVLSGGDGKKLPQGMKQGALGRLAASLDRPRITLRSDDDEIVFRAPVSREEAEYLKQLIEAVLSHH